MLMPHRAGKSQTDSDQTQLHDGVSTDGQASPANLVHKHGGVAQTLALPNPRDASSAEALLRNPTE